MMDAHELLTLMEQYYAQMSDGHIVERYDTARGYASGELGAFLAWLDEREEEEHRARIHMQVDDSVPLPLPSRPPLTDEQLNELDALVQCDNRDLYYQDIMSALIAEVREGRRVTEIDKTLYHEDRLYIVGWECRKCHQETIVPSYRGVHRFKFCCHCGAKIQWVDRAP